MKEAMTQSEIESQEGECGEVELSRKEASLYPEIPISDDSQDS